MGTYAGIYRSSVETFRTCVESVLQRMFLNTFSYCLYIFFYFFVFLILSIVFFTCLVFYVYPKVFCSGHVRADLT